ncbi:hypothetical protein GPECTOR_8g218 [Gonium pectorale]|uniref:UvrD-like helicase ATP-binding domain-containing protein n=1 Tax=Gonium pectorale TaxID=33097 RepID=A0A150GSK5_GONPE|nr:hypothetical protein GPECTOR_8g218 [Gonium pectorale]|eukprot:KXZ52835.1 hypothetical protein GPECTOR_8g218 [Gonium pectorale]
MANARVVFSTVAAVGSALLSSTHFPVPVRACVIDEAAQLVEAELAIVLARWPSALRLLVLVGDPKQLPSTVLSLGAKERGYGCSAFERVQGCGRSSMLLDTQYRMHPAISSWPRDTFYGGRVRDGPNVLSKSYDGVAELLGLAWGPYVVVDVGTGREEREQYDDDSGEEPSTAAIAARSGAGASQVRRGGGGSASWCNAHEVAVAAAVVRGVVESWRRLRAAASGDGGGGRDPAARMLLHPDRELSIGVISPYRAQVDAIAPRLASIALDRGDGVRVSVAVRSVDGFQGQEKDVIVLSMVRANPAGTVGFTADPRRLNVAATRARHGLVVLLHEATMRRHPLWARFLENARSRGLLQRAGEQTCLRGALKSVDLDVRRMANLQTAEQDLWRDKPWRVLYTDKLQASLLALERPQRVRVVDQVLAFASGRFPARIDPYAAVHEPFRYHLHVHLLRGGRLALLWGVRLHFLAAERRWVQALQVWDVLSTRHNGRVLLQWIRRIEAELRTFTDEHLAALRRRRPPDAQGAVMPWQWEGELPFRRTRDAQAAAAAGAGHEAAAGGDAARGPGGDGYGGAAGGAAGNADDSGGGGGGSRLLHNKYFLMDALYARLLCVAPRGAVLERMFELTAEQQVVVEARSSIILIGRSGTGKTSVILSRILAAEQAMAVLEGRHDDPDGGAGADPRVAREQAAAAANPAVPDGAGSSAGGGESARRQLLVTLSPKLAAATSKYLRDSMATFRAGLRKAGDNTGDGGERADGAAAEAGTGSDGDGDSGRGGLSALLDDEEAARQFGPLPERLADVSSGSCPLVLDLRRFLGMLDASMERPFAATQRQRALAAAANAAAARGRARRCHAGATGAGAAGGYEGEAEVDDGSDASDEDWDDEDEPGAAAARARAGGAQAEAEAALVEVDYDRFADSYWRHFSSELRKGIRDPALVWREVQTSIKGSLAALSSGCGSLGREEYVALADTRAGGELNAELRGRVYELFRRYEREKERRGEYDIADMTWHLHEQLAASGGGYPGAPFRFVYLDEVQDLTPAQIALFKYICPWPEDGMVLAGDTAQTIAKGVSFRFEALKDVFYHFFMKGQLQPKVPEVTPLLQNFRTHAQISRLAHFGVLEPLLHFFPDALDKLPPESSSIRGPKPLFLLPSCGAIEDMLSDGAPPPFASGSASGSSGGATGSTAAAGSAQDGKAAHPATGAGSEVVVLVPSEAAKEEARRRLSRSDVLVLTATESKGLEFKVVLLYNFFSASRLTPNKWRLLYRTMAAWGHLPDGAVEPGGSHACPTFDPQASPAHSGMAPELKALYVGVTRGREDVVVMESDPAACGPVRELWERTGLVDVRSGLDAGVLGRLQRKVSSEELRKRAQELVTTELYQDAAMMFDRLGDEQSRVFCEAQLARAAAKKAADRGHPDAARQHHARAAALFKQCGKHLSAAKSYESAGMWGDAGDVYHHHCREGLKAAACYEKARRWKDAAERLTEVERPDEGIVERAFDACRRANEYLLGVQAMGRWQEAAKAVSGSSISTITASRAAGAAAPSAAPPAATAPAVGRRAALYWRRMVSLGAVYWKDRPGGEEEMMRFVLMMPGEADQRGWLDRYQLYDMLLRLDIAAGRFLAAARTLERKGDAESLAQAAQYYCEGGAPLLAVELMLRKARAGALWGGKGGDWPPPSGGSASGKYLREAEELIDGSCASGGQGSANRADPLGGCRLEAALLKMLFGIGASRAEGGQRPLQRWEEWRVRLDGREAEAHGSATRMARLCLLRLLSSEALDRAQQLLKPSTQQASRQATGGAGALTQAQLRHQSRQPQAQPSQRQAVAEPSRGGSHADVHALSGGALELLRLWGPYSRLLLEVLRVLGRIQVVAASPRDAMLLAGVQAYHVVRPAGGAEQEGGTGGGGGGAAAAASGASSAGSPTGSLELGCPPSAAWVSRARERLRIALRAGAGAAGAAAAQLPQAISAADFAAAAGLYWRTELEAQSQRVLVALLAMASQLEPDYEAFKNLGQSGGLEYRDAGRSGGAGGGGAAGAVVSLDATQLRAQLLVAAATEARRLVQLAQEQAGGGAPCRQAAERSAALASTLELLFSATAAVPLPAMAHAGSLPAARHAAAEALELYGNEMLAAAAARGPRVVRPLQDSRAGRLWERPAHTHLTYEEVARAALLQPLLPEGWLLRTEQEGRVNWQVPWNARPEGLASWQLLLEAARAADIQRGLVPTGNEWKGTHLVAALSRFGLEALLEYHSGRSLTAKRREWDPWVGMKPLTFLTLLERYTILALSVTTRGLNNLVLPMSLVLDHMTQPGVSDLMSYSVRHTQLTPPNAPRVLHRLLCQVCELLRGLIVSPGGVQPANQLHAVGSAADASAGGSAGPWPTPAQQQRQQRPAPAGLKLDGKEAEELGMFLRRAVVLLFSVAINVRPLPPLPMYRGAGHVGPPPHNPSRPPAAYHQARAPYAPVPPQPLQQAPDPEPPEPAESCCAVVAASAVPGHGHGHGYPGAGRGSHPGRGGGSSAGLHAAMPLLPCTLRLLLDGLRWKLSATRSQRAFEPAMLGPEFSRAMLRGKDRLLKLYVRGVRSPEGMAWANNNKSVDVLDRREVPVPPMQPLPQPQRPLGQARTAGRAAAQKPLTRQLAFFRLPELLLTAAGEDLAGDEDETGGGHDAAGDGGHGGAAADGAAADLPEVAAEHAGDTGSLAGGGAADGPGDEGSAARLAAATANQLGRRCYTMTRLWLCRARQQLLLPALSPLKRARRAARAAVHFLAPAGLGDAARAYGGQLVELACPLQVEAEAAERRLERAVQWLLGQPRPRDEEAERRSAQLLDLALEYRERLHTCAAALDVASQPDLHRALDAAWLVGTVVLPLQQVLYEMGEDQELAEAMAAAAASAGQH